MPTRTEEIQETFRALHAFMDVKNNYPTLPLFRFCAYELQHAFVHMVKSTESTEREKKLSELGKAKAHILRAHLDFYKCCIFDPSHGCFLVHGSSFEFVKSLLPIRHCELKEISSGSYTDTFARCETLLSAYPSIVLPGVSPTPSPRAAWYLPEEQNILHPDTMILIKEWNRLEVVYSSLVGNKLLNLIEYFVAAYFSKDRGKRLPECLYQVKALIVHAALHITGAQTLSSYFTTHAAKHHLPFSFAYLQREINFPTPSLRSLVEQAFPLVEAFLGIEFDS